MLREKFGRINALFANAGIMSVPANAVLYAISQPDNVDVSDLVVHPTME